MLFLPLRPEELSPVQIVRSFHSDAQDDSFAQINQSFRRDNHNGHCHSATSCCDARLCARPSRGVLKAVSDEALDYFTPSAKQVLILAREEALLFHHNFVRTEHLLLGILRTTGT